MSHSVPQQLLIIAGSGTYPLLLAQGARAAGVARIYVVAVRGMASRRLGKLADEIVWFGIGETEKTLAWIVRSGAQHVIMAGQITPAALFRTRFDKLSRDLLNRMAVKNAHSIYGAVAQQITARGLQVLPASSFMDAHLPPAGTLTRRAPNAREWADIHLGLDIGLSVGDRDIGQTIVVKEGMVLAVEAFEGTNQAIRRAGKLGGAGGVVVKVAKNGHDVRLDIPVIGAQTLPVLRRARISALAFQAHRLILLDRAQVVQTADRLGIAIVAVATALPSVAAASAGDTHG